LDALFDAYLISFRDDGKILISDKIRLEDRQLLNLGEFHLSKPLSKAARTFMAAHRERAGLPHGG
jgi:hypothetical protein